MNIYENKKTKDDDSKITVAFVTSIMGCLGISEFLYFFILPGMDKSDGAVWWILTFIMYAGIVGAFILLVAAILHGAGFSGKRKKINNIF